MVELILGGARSGKSALAEQRASMSGLDVIYIATGQAGDAEMAARIAHHQSRRPDSWKIVEEPLHLSEALRKNASANHCIIVDCLTLWLTNLLCQGRAMQQSDACEVIDCPLLHTEMAQFFDVVSQLSGNIIFVSNEVGMGIVPMGAVNRLFVDEQGRLNQRLAKMAGRVTFVVAGLPMELALPVSHSG